MPENPVLFEVRDHVAHVTLNRPQAGNALDLEMAKELAAASLECERNRDARAVLLRGAGDRFCVGGDVKAFAAQADLPRYLREVTAHLHMAVSRFARLDAPVIAAVQGSAAGGGFSLAISCDLVLAAESATFLMAYSKIAMAPDGSSSYFLPRLVGFKRAMELALTNRVLSAREACEWGLVTEVVPPERLAARAEELARSLAQGPTGAFGSAKRLLHSGWNQSLETQMELESRAIAEAGGTVMEERESGRLWKNEASFEWVFLGIPAEAREPYWRPIISSHGDTEARRRTGMSKLVYRRAVFTKADFNAKQAEYVQTIYF